MKKWLTAGLTAVFLLLGSACGTPDEVREDRIIQDNRAISERSATIEGIRIELVEYSLYYTEYKGRKPGGRGYFFIIQYEVENTTDHSTGFSLEQVNIVSTLGVEYPYSTYGLGSTGDGVNFSLKDIQPGEGFTGKLVMEMPSGTTPDSIVLIEEDMYGQVIDIPDLKEVE